MKTTAWLLSTVQNGSNAVQILGFFGDEFHKESLHFICFLERLSPLIN